MEKQTDGGTVRLTSEKEKALAGMLKEKLNNAVKGGHKGEVARMTADFVLENGFFIEDAVETEEVSESIRRAKAMLRVPFVAFCKSDGLFLGLIDKSRRKWYTVANLFETKGRYIV